MSENGLQPDENKREKSDQGVQVTLSEELASRLRQYKDRSGLSHPNILFDAIEFSLDDLPHLIQNRSTSLDPGRKKLFDRPSAPIRSDEGPTETFIVRVTPSNKKIIDDLWKQLEAPSRKALLAVAYRAYLDAKQPEG